MPHSPHSALTPKDGAFIPHTKAMCFVDQVLSLDVEHGVGEFGLTIRPDKHYWRSGSGLDDAWLIEILAQAVAGLFHFQSGGDKKPKVGFLVGIDHFKCLGQEPLALGDHLRITVRLVTEFYPFGVYEGSIWHRDTLYAQGELKFVVAEEEAGN